MWSRTDRCLSFLGATAIVVIGALHLGAGRSVANVTSRRHPARTVRKPPLLVARADLPGEYYFGDGLGVNCMLTLLTHGRFRFRWTGCLGDYDRNYGAWTVDGDRLLLHPERANPHKGFEGMDLRFIPVQWGARIWLVDENQMPGFCDMAREGWPASGRDIHGEQYVKLIKVPVSGSAVGKRPRVPERYREFLEQGSASATVRRTLPDGTVLLDCGLRTRMRPGLLLAWVGDGPATDLEILSVTKDSAVGRPVYYFNCNRWVRVGDRFVTGEERRSPRGTGWPRLTAPPDVPKLRRSKASLHARRRRSKVNAIRERIQRPLRRQAGSRKDAPLRRTGAQ